MDIVNKNLKRAQKFEQWCSKKNNPPKEIGNLAKNDLTIPLFVFIILYVKYWEKLREVVKNINIKHYFCFTTKIVSSQIYRNSIFIYIIL